MELQEENGPWCPRVLGNTFSITLGGIVKLLGMIWAPGNNKHFPEAMSADPTLRRPAPYR
jgi:hypothetical protein